MNDEIEAERPFEQPRAEQVDRECPLSEVPGAEDRRAPLRKLCNVCEASMEARAEKGLTSRGYGEEANPKTGLCARHEQYEHDLREFLREQAKMMGDKWNADAGKAATASFRERWRATRGVNPYAAPAGERVWDPGDT